MKPRLEPVRLTDEDLRIWRRICVFKFHIPASLRGREVCAEKAAQNADRRDANLMWAAQRWRRGEMVTDHTYAHSGPEFGFAVDGIRCGGGLLP